MNTRRARSTGGRGATFRPAPVYDHVAQLRVYKSDCGREEKIRANACPVEYLNALEVFATAAGRKFGVTAAYCLHSGACTLLNELPALDTIADAHAVALLANDAVSLPWFRRFAYEVPAADGRDDPLLSVTALEQSVVRALVKKARIPVGSAIALSFAAVLFQVPAVHPELQEAMLATLQAFTAKVEERAKQAEAHARRIQAEAMPERRIFTLAQAFRRGE
jgi:hypothetical protein